MKWTVDQIEQYLQAKEYIDTAIIPLIPIDWSNNPKENASKAEFILAVTDTIENHFVGRIFQMPAFTYISDEGGVCMTSLRAWNSHFSQNGFTHVFFISSDNERRIVEDELPDALIWLPEISLEEIEPAHKKKIINHQAQQTFPLITNKWSLPVKGKND